MISIIICSIDSKRFSNVTRNYADLMADEPFEIIGIHDAKSLCEGYNRGIKKSVGDILVFSHDDIEILSSDFVARLKAHMEHFDIVGLAGTDKVVGGGWVNAGIPHLYGQVANPGGAGYQVAFFDYGKIANQGKVTADGIKMLDGFFFAVRRSVVQQVLFDERNFDGFHGYDVDFTYSAYLAGFNLTVCNDIAVIHDSGGSFDATFQKYKRRFLIKHRATVDIPEPLASRPAPTFAVMDCVNKEEVLSHFEPQKQIYVYEQFVAMFPALIAVSASTGLGLLRKKLWNFVRLSVQRAKLFLWAF